MFPNFIQTQLDPDISSKTIEIEGNTIHYLEYGKGIPVFMMHGNPTWSFLYRNIIKQLDPTKFRCIAPDLPGLGFSFKPPQSFHTLENHERIMSAFLKEVINDDFIFCGQDWGGPIGLLASINHSKSLKGMVLLNTSIRTPRPNFKPSWFHSFSRMPIVSDLTFRVFGFPQNQLHKIQGDPSSIRDDVKRAYLYPLKGLSKNAAPLALARMVPNSLDHPSVKFIRKTEEFAKKFKEPVTLIWGKNDPILGRLATAHQKIMEHAKVNLTDGGHFIQEEYPELIANEISSLLK